MKYTIAIIVLFTACQMEPPESAAASAADQAVTTACSSPRSFGAIPDDGADDRAALQAALNACAGATLTLEAGRYDVITPPAPRPYAMLTLPAGLTLQGAGVSSVIAFSGDNSGGDWRGIQLGNHTLIQHLKLISDFTPGTTNEQTHIIRGDGPLTDVTVTDVVINHPAHTSKSGDCIQFVGYPPSDTSPDKRIWNANVHHVTFERCDRSGIAVHSGLHGTLVGGHFTTRFNNNLFVGISDQDIDGEGSGDTDGVEIDHNTFQIPANLESMIAIQIQASSHIHIHDNDLARGIDLYGCSSCELDHNIVTKTLAGTDPVVNLRKLSSNVVFHDETYTRAASAGPGVVLQVAQKIGAPDHITIADTQLIQHADAAALYTSGIVGLQLLRSTITYDGVNGVPGRIDGIVMNGSAGDLGIRSTDLHVIDSVINGPYRAAIGISGSYEGVGTLEVTRTHATGSVQGLRCENIATGAGITGPVTYVDNQLPPAICSPLVP